MLAPSLYARVDVDIFVLVLDQMLHQIQNVSKMLKILALNQLLLIDH